MRLALICVVSASLAFHSSLAQETDNPIPSHLDSDRDGLNDALEQSLLEQFAPTFFIGPQDCSNVPAEFQAGVISPEVKHENGAIYGQVFPVSNGPQTPQVAEIHYYHLWKQDCGGHGHPLDTEHVAVLVQASDSSLVSAKWKALYWYAAAHENTVCDVSQIARASTLHAEDHGAKVWISPGKHASYLNETLCQSGCGADHCEKMTALAPGKLINLGEPGHPMNDSQFIASPLWPLAGKMSNTNFPTEQLARLNQLPDTDIAWFNTGRHPAQGIIAISSSTQQTIASGGRNTTSAVSAAGDSTGTAISTAGDSTGNALQDSYHHTKHALGTAVHNVGKALHLDPKPETPK
jgi:hypothetical protein